MVYDSLKICCFNLSIATAIILTMKHLSNACYAGGRSKKIGYEKQKKHDKVGVLPALTFCPNLPALAMSTLH